MPMEYEYACTRCGKMKHRDVLTVKRVMFTTMGEGSRTIRSRVMEWLCNDCVQSDKEWNLPPWKSPGERAKIVTPPTPTVHPPIAEWVEPEGYEDWEKS